MDEKFMKEKPVLPLILSMSLPMVLSMLVNSLYNIVDSFFVAQISEDAMTALSLVFPVQNFINAVAIGFAIGINAAIAFYLGREEYSRAFKNKPLIVVINRYNSTKGSIKETANWMGIKKPNGWLVLHENPWITWATNHGRLGELFRQIEKKDARVIELASDLTKLGSTVLRAKTSMVKKSGGRK